MTITKFSVNKKKNKIILDIILVLCILLLLIILLSSPVHYSNMFIEGLMLFATSVMPGLFPFMFLTRILTNISSIKRLSNKCNKFMQKCFKSPGIGAYTMLLSNISGYPIGAKIIGDLVTNQIVDDCEAKNMLTYSMTSGPIFMIGTVGAIMFRNTKVGIIIMISHLLSNIITGIILCNIKSSKTNRTPLLLNEPILNNSKHIEIDKILSDSMISSVQSILIVGGFISIFYVFTGILFDLKVINIISIPISKLFEIIGINPQISRGIMSGIIEVTRGIKELSPFFSSYPKIVTSLSSALISFSGLSIIFQSKAFLAHTKIKTRFLIFSKSVHAIICFITCLIICNIIF